MAEPQMCGECGCKHRPGENTLCPGWRPGPFVPDPTPERIAAALALADSTSSLALASDDPSGSKVTLEMLHAHQAKIRAYRATAPKLRTRAEVDAQIAAEIRASVALGSQCDCLTGPAQSDGLRSSRIRVLCCEPTAEPTPYGSSSDESASSPRVDAAAGAAYSRDNVIYTSLPDPEPCSCEATERKLVAARKVAAKMQVDLLRCAVSRSELHRELNRHFAELLEALS
jgi:hypothetical protein